MNITIKYNDIINRCEMLSAFEAKDRFDANGESRFLEIHINEVDKQLIQQYIIQARSILEERMSRCIRNSTDTTFIDREEGLDTHVTFEEFIPNGSIMSDYFIDRESDPSEYKYGGMVFSELLGQFCYKINQQPTNNPPTTNGYTLFTNISYLGADYSLQFMYDKSIRKGYTCIADNKQYEWGDNGKSLKPYTPPAEDKVIEYGFTVEISAERWKSNSSFLRHITEALVSYAMAQWLRDKLDDRVSFYENLFNNSLNMAIKNIFTKQAPV